MKRIVVTGANKGIGLAIVRGALAEHADAQVFLGSRDPGRGEAARRSLLDENASWGERVEVLEIDVASDTSVQAAAQRVKAKLGDEKLYGIVNNAGIGLGDSDMRGVLNVNTTGVHRVCTALLPLLRVDGRIVNVTSASGPNFVNDCSPDRQKFFLDRSVTWEQIEGVIEEAVAIDSEEGFQASGLGGGAPYGLSKALANSYTMLLAREHAQLTVNACTPGFIATDMTRPYAERSGKTPADMGMKTPDEGARCPLHLLFDELEGNGWYYGSDSQRSPLDRYRAPGSAPYTGE